MTAMLLDRELVTRDGRREGIMHGVRRVAGFAGVTGLDGVLAKARDDVILMSTLSTAAAAFRMIDGSCARRGVRYRAVFPDEARLRPALCAHLAALSAAGVAVRTVAEVPMDVLIVDGEVAVLPADGSSGVVALRLSSAITAARALFERIWPVAVPLTASDAPDGAELTTRERELITLLALGATDESAASQLGVSVRTVRRAVAALMSRLGARSRFQAGVKAADRGWLLERVS